MSSASAFAGVRFPREVISVAVQWYLRHGLLYRDVEELLAERGVTVDHGTIYRRVQRFTPEFVEAGLGRVDTCRVLAGQPVGLHVGLEGDGGEAGVAPAAGQDSSFFSVGGALGATTRGVGSCGADPPFAVAVAGEVPVVPSSFVRATT